MYVYHVYISLHWIQQIIHSSDTVCHAAGMEQQSHLISFSSRYVNAQQLLALRLHVRLDHYTLS